MKVHVHETLREHKQRTFGWFWGKYLGFVLLLFGIAFAFATKPLGRFFSGILIFLGLGIFLANWIDQKIHKKVYHYR